MNKEKIYVELPPFTGRNVPVTEIAKAMHKDAQYVRIGLQQGILNFGYAIKMGDSNEYSYYCPDRKVWEEIGYFRPEEEIKTPIYEDESFERKKYMNYERER